VRGYEGSRALAVGQGAFYLVTGIWPLVHVASFVAVTGPKQDLWLAQTVGALLAVSGIAFVGAAARRRLTPEVRFLAGGQAVVLGIVDVVFVLRATISAIYLADAAVEFALAIAWLAAIPPARAQKQAVHTSVGRQTSE
jgi:hypothetical protein